MTTSNGTRIAAQASLALLFASATAGALDRAPLPGMMPFPNPSGFAASYSTTGSIDFTNPFFRSLGANGRSCESCHQANEGWTVTPDGIRRRFVATSGLDPIFRLNDGANAPGLDVSTVEVSGVLVTTTDPGRALVTGRWKDIGRFKGPALRALATRAPYVHDGSAADLGAVIDFYEKRFDIGFTEQEKRDLAAFLRTL